MQTDNPALRERTGYALFDDRQVLVDANAEIFGGSAPARADFPKMDLVAVITKVLPYFERFDGLAVERTDRFARDVALRWRQGNVPPVEAQTIDGDWKLLSSHSRPDGGIALVSTDITEMKRAQIAHLENAEIFRCITESHPLPVWVVDEDSKQILYESLDASTLLGRKWRSDEPQYMTAHFSRSGRIQENQIAGRQARAGARSRNPAQARQRIGCLVLGQLPARPLSRETHTRHRCARHHRAQATRGSVRLPD